MILHCRSCVDSCQGGPNINHELVVEPPVVQVMAYCSYPQPKTLQLLKHCFRFDSFKNLIRCVYSRRGLEDAVDTVTHMEPMSPVVISHCSVVGFHCYQELYLRG